MTEPLSHAVLPVSVRRAAGKAARSRLPRSALGQWREAAPRPDPVEILVETSRHRIPDLLAIRWGRMAVSPFTFLRGAAAVMARDLGKGADSGLRVQACGDCHLMNFGAFATPEGNAVFDINDFDETLPAPFEWDILRLAASIAVAAMDGGRPRRAAADIVRAAVVAYRSRMGELAIQTPLEVWHDRIDIGDALVGQALPKLRNLAVRGAAEARHPDPVDPNFPRLAENDGGIWRFKDIPPLVRHFDGGRDDVHDLDTRAAFAAYRRCLQDDHRLLLDRYALADVAFKVVGVGSVGTFCAVGLFLTADGAPLILQVKEASASVLAPYAGASRYANQGRRVVAGQKVIQGASDPFSAGPRMEWAAGISTCAA